MLALSSMEEGSGQAMFSVINGTPNQVPTEVQLSSETIDENAPNGTVVGSLEAVDPDVDDVHTFTLINSAQDRFAITGNELILIDGQQLDFGVQATHDITVRATDSGGATFDQQLTVQVNDVVPSVDLVVEGVNISREIATFGESLDVSWTVRNQGAESALSNGSDRIYLSTDTTLSLNDIAIGTVPAGRTQLGPDETYSQAMSVTLPNGTALSSGEYYLLVKSDDSNRQEETNDNNNIGITNLTAIAPTFSLNSINTRRGSNLGKATITLSGAQFSSDALISLTAPDGSTIPTNDVHWQSSTELWATFDLQALSEGLYDIKVNQNGDTATLANQFTVTDGPAGALSVDILSSSSVQAGKTGIVTVTYTNTGDTDIVAPLLQINADNAIFKTLGTEDFTAEPIQRLAISSQGPAGILPPGTTGSFSFEFEPLAGANTEIEFTVDTLTENTVIDRDNIRNIARPEHLSDVEWNLVWENFVTGVETTTDTYVATLAENATHLSKLGIATSDVARLTAFELQQASDYQSLPQRYSLGAFGRGRSFVGDLFVETEINGDVSIINRGLARLFSQQLDGSYQGIEGDDAILTLTDDRYRLIEEEGSITQFLASGKLDYTEDINGNRVTAGYTDGLLTSLVSTLTSELETASDSSDTLLFTYNEQDRIVRVVNSSGQEITYGYDPSGELLTSATTAAGTTQYRYDSRLNLTGITNSDSTQVSFAYDEQGRLTQAGLADGTETIGYAYDTAGGVTITDAAGVQTQVLLNDRGQVSRLTDSLERSLQVRYDEIGNATQMIAPDGSIDELIYDDQGRLTTRIDPLGQQTEFTYEPNYNQLQSLTDARGNALDYAYDDRGNLTSITHADGSQEIFSHDENGSVTQSANRRGQTIDYTYSTQGQLLNQIDAAGSVLSYSYSTQGNLTAATNSAGTVSMDYDAANRLTKITYPSGRSLAYEYDAIGRRTRLEDGNGNIVNYTYDAIGRLVELADDVGIIIASYQYDETGRLSLETNGNETSTAYSYDAVGQLSSITNYASDGSINSFENYTYDVLGQQTDVATQDGAWRYTYDASGQLVRAVLSSTNAEISDQDIAYEYDATGNRTRTTVNGETTAYIANDLNQYESSGETLYEYDNDGNLISKVESGEVWTYRYDVENRLVGVTEPNSRETLYEYDALGNRIATVYDGDRTEYLVDPLGFGDVVGEYGPNGSVIAKYVHGIGLVSRTDSASETAFYDHNSVGSTIGLTGANGRYLNRYSYRPFGQDIYKEEVIANPFEFVGQWGVTEESNGLIYMRERFYDDQIGRFMNPDPIGIFGGQTNLLSYVNNSPTNFIDPNGLRPYGNGAYVDWNNEEEVFDFAFRPIWDSIVDTFDSIGEGVEQAASYVYDTIADTTRYTFSCNGLNDFSAIAGNASVFSAGVAVATAPAAVSGVGGIAPAGWASLAAVYEVLSQTTGLAHDQFCSPSEAEAYANRLLDQQIAQQANQWVDPLLRSLPPATRPFAEKIISIIVETGVDEFFRKPDNSSTSKGEPHLTTFDGVGYSFQGAGEFTLARSKPTGSQSDSLNVQVRYVQIDSRATVASAVAADVDGQKVVIDSGGVQFDENGIPFVTRSTSGEIPTVTIDGQIVDIANNSELDIGNGRLYRRSNEYTLVLAGENGTLEDGDDQLVVNYFRPGTLNTVKLYLGNEKKDEIHGLLGNLNDDPSDDIALADGTPIANNGSVRTSDLYGAYRESWRVKSEEDSLFNYEPGQTPDTFYNANFPLNPVSFNDLDSAAQQRGREAAIAAGYEPGTFEFLSAAFDFAVTNDPSFLEGQTTDRPAETVISIINDGIPSIDSASNFLGTEIQLQYLYPSITSTPTENSVATVNDDVEFQLASYDPDPSNSEFQPGYIIDIDGTSITYQAVESPVDSPQFVPADFNGIVFSDVADTLPAITGVVLNPSETSSRLASSEIAFTENTISVNFEGLSYRPGDTVKLDVTFGQESTFLQPDSAVASSEFSDRYKANYTIDGSGLPEGFGPDDLHNPYTYDNHWTSALNTDPLDQVINWGFNVPQNLDEIYLWNHQSTEGWADNPGYDVTLFDVTLFDGVDNILLQFDDIPLQPDTNASQAFSLGSVVSSVSRVQLKIEDVQSSPSFTGIAEVGFNAIPT